MNEKSDQESNDGRSNTVKQPFVVIVKPVHTVDSTIQSNSDVKSSILTLYRMVQNGIGKVPLTMPSRLIFKTFKGTLGP